MIRGKYVNTGTLPPTANSATMTLTIRGSLLRAVDCGLLALGEMARATVYHCLLTTRGLTRDEIPDKLDSFHKGLQQLLGPGTLVIEKIIAKSLYSKLGLTFMERKGWTLVDYVRHATNPFGITRSHSNETNSPSASSRIVPTNAEDDNETMRATSFYESHELLQTATATVVSHSPPEDPMKQTPRISTSHDAASLVPTVLHDLGIPTRPTTPLINEVAPLGS